QRPLRTMHAAPGPSSAWQSVSVLQNRQIAAASPFITSVKSAQKPALPVVCAQAQSSLPEWHGTFTPREQAVASGKQTSLLCATQVVVPGSQMPEQHNALLPWQGCPTSRHPNSFNGRGGCIAAFLCFVPFLCLCFFLASTSDAGRDQPVREA